MQRSPVTDNGCDIKDSGSIRHNQMLKLAKALDSGAYEQLPPLAFLRLNDKYCPLGVMCDLVAPDKWEPSDKDPGCWKHLGACSLPTDEVLHAFGCVYSADEIRIPMEFLEDHERAEVFRAHRTWNAEWEGDEYLVLPDLNDARIPFTRIATLIRQTVVEEQSCENSR